MKHILFSFLLLLAGNFLAAQSATDPVRLATDQLVQKYQLDEAQSKEMYSIQQRKARNMAEIAALETENPALYRAKMRSIQNGNDASIRRILNNKEQTKRFQQNQSAVRTARAAKRKEMLQQGASQEAIEMAELTLYED